MSWIKCDAGELELFETILDSADFTDDVTDGRWLIRETKIERNVEPGEFPAKSFVPATWNFEGAGDTVGDDVGFTDAAILVSGRQAHMGEEWQPAVGCTATIGEEGTAEQRIVKWN